MYYTSKKHGKTLEVTVNNTLYYLFYILVSFYIFLDYFYKNLEP